MGTLMLRNQEAAIKAAHELVRDFDVSDMAYNASELIADLKSHDRIIQGPQADAEELGAVPGVEI